jgi:hypothetical protein
MTDVHALIALFKDTRDLDALDALIDQARGFSDNAGLAGWFLRDVRSPLRQVVLDRLSHRVASPDKTARLEIARLILYLDVEREAAALLDDAYAALAEAGEDVEEILSRVNDSGRLPDPAGDALRALIQRHPEAVRSIVALMDEDSMLTGIAFIESYEYLPGLPKLRQIADDESQPEDTRQAAAGAWDKLREIAWDTERVLEWLDVGDEGERYWAADELITNGRTPVLTEDRIREMANSKNPDTRWVAVSLLSDMNDIVLELAHDAWFRYDSTAAPFANVVVGHDPAFDRLMAGMLHDNPNVTIGALCELDARVAEEWPPLFEIAAEYARRTDLPGNIRMAAVHALASDVGTWGQLLLAMLDDDDLMVRTEARSVLLRCGYRGLRWQAALRLVTHGDRDALERVLDILQDEIDPTHRLGECEIALKNLPEPVGRHLRSILRRIGNDDSETSAKKAAAGAVLARLTA